MKNTINRLCGMLLVFVMVLLLMGCHASDERPVIGIAWRTDVSANSYVHTALAIEKAGGTPVLLGQIISEELSYNERNILSGGTDAVGALSVESAERLKDGTWKDSNARKVMKNIDAVVFTGGEDISPSLYQEPQQWHGIFEEINYNATRDVSDYLLMTYCLDNDIPTLGICRGMQLMAVAAGAEMIQDLPAWFAQQGKEYDHLHRYLPGTPEGERDYVPHDVTVTQGSFASDIFGSGILTGCPSLHHQAVISLNGTGFQISGTTQTCGVEMIEIMEHPEKRFLLGFQFHPEAAVRETPDPEFMSEEAALKVFWALVNAAKSK